MNYACVDVVYRANNDAMESKNNPIAMAWTKEQKERERDRAKYGSHCDIEQERVRDIGIEKHTTIESIDINPRGWFLFHIVYLWGCRSIEEERVMYLMSRD